LACPPGFSTAWNFGVNVAAKCNSDSRLCDRCIGSSDPTGIPGFDEWPNEVNKYSDTRVTDGLPIPSQCNKTT